MDPFLDSINHMLMQEEGLEDASCMQQDSDASYQTILRSFYDTIGEHPPPKSSVVSTNLSALHIPHQIAETQHAVHSNGFKSLTPSDQTLISGASSATLPAATGNLQTNFFQDTSLVLPGQARHIICPHSANWNALSTTKAQDYQAPIKFNDGKLMDTNTSCWEKDKALNDSSRSCSGRGSNAHFQPHLKLLAGVEFAFEHLRLHNHYAALYLGDPGIPIGPSKYGDKERALAVIGKRGTSGRKRTAHRQEYVDLRDLIVKFGQAVAVGNARVGNELYQDIRRVHGACADGNASQRAAHYFSEALVARMRGIGGHLFRTMLHKQPSAVKILELYKMSHEVSALIKVVHYFANQSILKAAERASRLHIVDYGLERSGIIQWAFLINALADRKGGPPLLVMTVIDSPQPGNNPAARLEEYGWRFAVHARTYNVPFQYHAIVSSKWQDLDSSSFHCHEDEVLVVNCLMSMHLIADESDIGMVSPRQKFLRCIHSLKPHLLLTAHVNAAYNCSLFVSRLQNVLYYFSNVFDMLETVWGDASPERILRERMSYRKILNIVACEGAERVEREETYKQWQVRIQRAGFQQLLIPPLILSRSKSHVKQHYHKDFFVHEDANKWMLLGWKGCTLLASSAWKLRHDQL